MNLQGTFGPLNIIMIDGLLSTSPIALFSFIAPLLVLSQSRARPYHFEVTSSLICRPRQCFVVTLLHGLGIDVEGHELMLVLYPDPQVRVLSLKAMVRREGDRTQYALGFKFVFLIPNRLKHIQSTGGFASGVLAP